MTAPDAPTDEALLAAFVGGDRRAYELLVARHARRVYAICYRYFHDAADAEDAAQETFVALLRRGSTFAGGARFSTWLYRVAMNSCNDIARRRARRPQTVPLPEHDLPAWDRSVEDLFAAQDLHEDLRRALALLDREQREAIVLHDVLGLSYAEIAARSGVALGTVKSRIHRGHARLADLLADFRPERPREPSSLERPPTVQP